MDFSKLNFGKATSEQQLRFKQEIEGWAKALLSEGYPSDNIQELLNFLPMNGSVLSRYIATDSAAQPFARKAGMVWMEFAYSIT